VGKKGRGINTDFVAWDQSHKDGVEGRGRGFVKDTSREKTEVFRGGIPCELGGAKTSPELSTK